MMEKLREAIEMCPPEENLENEADRVTNAMGAAGRNLIDRTIRLRIETLCLEELNKGCNRLSADKHHQIEKMLLRIVSRIAEPILGQILEVNGNRNRRAHNLQMITKAFELKKVERSQ